MPVSTILGLWVDVCLINFPGSWAMRVHESRLISKQQVYLWLGLYLIMVISDSCACRSIIYFIKQHRADGGGGILNIFEYREYMTKILFHWSSYIDVISLCLWEGAVTLGTNTINFNSTRNRNGHQGRWFVCFMPVQVNFMLFTHTFDSLSSLLWEGETQRERAGFYNILL